MGEACNFCRVVYGLCEGHIYEGDRNLLSDHVLIVVSLNLEGAVIGPKINRCADAGNTALVDLSTRQFSVVTLVTHGTLTISAASVPAMANSRSAYFFQ